MNKNYANVVAWWQIAVMVVVGVLWYLDYRDTRNSKWR